jgi:hypothetical protein
MQQEHAPTDYVQEDFFHLLPGFAGGRALYIQRGPEHFRNLAYISAGRPEEERRLAALRGALTRLRRLYTVPRTEVSDWPVFDTIYRITERVIPWFPDRGRKRKRPVFVRIELSVEKVEKYREDGLDTTGD